GVATFLLVRSHDQTKEQESPRLLVSQREQERTIHEKLDRRRRSRRDHNLDPKGGNRCSLRPLLVHIDEDVLRRLGDPVTSAGVRVDAARQWRTGRGTL